MKLSSQQLEKIKSDLSDKYQSNVISILDDYINTYPMYTKDNAIGQIKRISSKYDEVISSLESFVPNE